MPTATDPRTGRQYQFINDSSDAQPTLLEGQRLLVIESVSPIDENHVSVYAVCYYFSQVKQLLTMYRAAYAVDDSTVGHNPEDQPLFSDAINETGFHVGNIAQGHGWELTFRYVKRQ